MTALDWSDVRVVSASALVPGDRCITPSCGTVYHVYNDGSVTGRGWLPLEGMTWTVERINPETGAVTARTERGAVVTETPKPAATVLRVMSGG